MSHVITELKNLSFGEITNNDYIIVTEVTNSLGEIQTKTMDIGECMKYNITSSNVLNSFRSGSHSGAFIGNLTGSSLSSSVSTTASFSDTTNYLNYSSNNGTASYSINAKSASVNSNSLYSLTSSYSTSSLTSSIASYVNGGTVTYKANTSDFSNNSITGSISETTNYLNFNGSDNGIVYHSITSDTCSYSSISSELSYPNKSNAYRSITSSYSFTSVSSSYSLSSSYTDFSISSILSESEAHAYITLLINGTPKTIEDAIENENISSVVSIKQYYNINKVIISPGVSDSIEIIVQFENELKDEKSAIIKADSSSRLQFDPAAYSNNTDLYSYTPSFNAQASPPADDYAPWDIVVGKSCSKSIAKITLIGYRFAARGDESNAEMFPIPATTVFNRSYISLLVLNGNAIGDGKNYPETPPTTIPPKC